MGTEIRGKRRRSSSRVTVEGLVQEGVERGRGRVEGESEEGESSSSAGGEASSVAAGASVSGCWRKRPGGGGVRGRLAATSKSTNARRKAGERSWAARRPHCAVSLGRGPLYRRETHAPRDARHRALPPYCALAIPLPRPLQSLAGLAPPSANGRCGKQRACCLLTHPP